MTIEGGCLGCDDVAQLAATADLATLAGVTTSSGGAPFAGVDSDPNNLAPQRSLFSAPRPTVFDPPTVFPSTQQLFDRARR